MQKMNSKPNQRTPRIEIQTQPQSSPLPRTKDGRILYAAYGSNLNLAQMAARCPHAVIYAKGALHGHHLLFRGFDGNAVATVEHCAKGNSANERVPILIWSITESDLAALDRYEGYPTLYRREIIDISVNGKRIPSLSYIMNDGREKGRPGFFYYNTIRTGYEQAGFPTDYLQKSAQASKPEKSKRRSN